MSENKWKSISLPKEMVEKIRKIIEQHPDLGYSSMAEFITEAIRQHPNYQLEVKRKPRPVVSVGRPD